MAVVAFWNNEKKETGQTLSMVALSTYMAIEHNYRILNIATGFSERSLENCFWNDSKNNLGLLTGNQAGNLGFETGVEGLIKVIKSNRTSNNIIADYAKVIFKDRYDILCSSNTKNYEYYKEIASMYEAILNVATKSYDIVFIDLTRTIPIDQKTKILELADVIIANINQNIQAIEMFEALRSQNPFFKKNKILLNVGKYDIDSKYNTKNITRYLKEKKEINAVPYNTLFAEAASEAKVVELFLKIRKAEDDKNGTFIKELARFSENLIYKMQELQMKI